MNLLCVDASGTASSAAVFAGGKLAGEVFSNVKMTHSETLLPNVKTLCDSLRIPIGEIGLFAVTVGPGSFTGLRIGISLVKGLAFAKDLRCVPVSTLEALANGAVLAEKLICPCMDARCGQVYNALFESVGGKLMRLCEDRAISAEALVAELNAQGRQVLLTGDGAGIVMALAKDKDKYAIAPENLLYQRASFFGSLALAKYERGESLPPADLVPNYLRIPQAQRELNARIGKMD